MMKDSKDAIDKYIFGFLSDRKRCLQIIEFSTTNFNNTFLIYPFEPQLRILYYRGWHLTMVA